MFISRAGASISLRKVEQGLVHQRGVWGVAVMMDVWT
jgi:hypothetical protein